MFHLSLLVLDIPACNIIFFPNSKYVDDLEVDFVGFPRSCKQTVVTVYFICVYECINFQVHLPPGLDSIRKR